MTLYHMYDSHQDWLEGKLEELEEIENKANLRKVPIDTNPFKKGS